MYKGYAFTLSQAPVSWRSTLQSTVALSTTEAEYMAITLTMKEVIWLEGLLDDFRIYHDLLKINCDSMSATYLVNNQIYHVKMHHIDIRFHFVWETLDEGDIELQKIHTKENLADMLTKVVPGVKFAHCKELLYILSVVSALWSSFG